MDNNKNNNTFVKRQEFIENDPILKKRRNDSACRIFTYLYNLYIYSGKDPYCSNSHISQATNIPISTVKDNLKWLEDRSYLMRVFRSKTGQNLRAFVVLQDQQKIETRTIISQLINGINTQLALGRPNYVAMTSCIACYAELRPPHGRSSSMHIADNRPSTRTMTVHNNILDNKIYKKEDRRDDKPIEKTNLSPTVEGKSSSSIFKNNSVENKSDSYLPTYLSEEPQTKPKTMADVFSGYAVDPTLEQMPEGLSPTCQKLWQDETLKGWANGVIKENGVNKTFAQILIKYENKSTVPLTSAIIRSWLPHEDNRQEKKEYDPRRSVAPPKKELTEAEIAAKKRALEVAKEEGEKVARSRHAAGVIKNHPEDFKELLRKPIYERQIILSHAGCTSDYFSKESIKQKLKDYNYGE